jgi:hypothetical protein
MENALYAFYGALTPDQRAMSKEADDYRELAKYCLEIANCLPPGEARNHMLGRANRWLEYARAVDQRKMPPRAENH